MWSDIFVVGGNSAQEVQDALSRGPFTGDTFVVLPGEMLEYGLQERPERVHLLSVWSHMEIPLRPYRHRAMCVNASFPGGTTYTLTVLGGSLLTAPSRRFFPRERHPPQEAFFREWDTAC